MERRFPLLISADSHVQEPKELWWQALGEKYGDRTPRVVEEYRGVKGQVFFIHSNRVSKIKSTEGELEKRGAPLNAGYDPAARVKFQEDAGIDAEVLNPQKGMGFLNGEDQEVMRASAGVYNDWIAEFCAHDPKRLLGFAVVPSMDVPWAVAELKRTVKKGLKGAMVNLQPLEGYPPYRDETYDPLWATAQDLDVPLVLHLATGRARTALQLEYLFGTSNGDTNMKTAVEESPKRHIAARVEVMDILATDFVFGQILDRFPNLQIYVSEFEISWIPWFLFRIDEMQEVFARRIPLPQLKMKASEQVLSRLWHGIIDDPYALPTIEMLGLWDVVMWGSDFPGIRSFALESHKEVAEMLGKMPREDQNKIVGDNIAKLLGWS